MVQVRFESGLVEWEPDLLVFAHRDGRVPPLTPVSFDGGATWTTAAVAVMRIDQQRLVDDSWNRFVPKGVTPLAHLAAVVVPTIAVFFAMPVLATVCREADKPYKSTFERLSWLLFGFVLCVVPLTGLGLAGLRSVKKQPHLRGLGRARFATVVGAALSLPLLISFVKVLR